MDCLGSRSQGQQCDGLDEAIQTARVMILIYEKFAT